jgi:uncharacterized membrane protein
MNLPAALFPDGWHWVSFLIALAIGYRLATTAPWKRLADAAQLNLLAGFAVSLTLMWSMKAGVMPGLNLHLLGAMAATLALGPHLAIVALGLALAGITLNGAIEWQAWPINFLVMVIAPVLFAHGFQRFVERVLPAHFFVFIFVVAFVGSALAVALSGLAGSLALIAAGAYPLAFLASDYLPYFILLCFSEAWISGAILSLLVVYKPGWVVAFDDRRYLLNK